MDEDGYVDDILEALRILGNATAVSYTAEELKEGFAAVLIAARDLRKRPGSLRVGRMPGCLLTHADSRERRSVRRLYGGRAGGFRGVGHWGHPLRGGCEE